MVKMSDFEVAGKRIAPGTRQHITLPAARLYNDAPLDLRLEVFHGSRPGPVLLVCAAIHGDELNGIDVCRRLVERTDASKLSGTLIVVPIVNLLGFIQQSRYLPDRRDLNRCFPGSERGALGSRMAYLFSQELVRKATHIIDLHTGAIHRSNLPQIRVNVDDEASLNMAKAFAAPVILHAKERDGSLRSLANEWGIPLILYEAGEALRFDQAAISAGVDGVENVMKHLRMARGRKKRQRLVPVIARRSTWLRSEHDGLIVTQVGLGQTVKKGQHVAASVSPHGDDAEPIVASVNGIVIGLSNIPVANEGEALFNIAQFDAEELGEAEDNIDHFTEQFVSTTPL